MASMHAALVGPADTGAVLMCRSWMIRDINPELGRAVIYYTLYRRTAFTIPLNLCQSSALYMLPAECIGPAAGY